MISQTEIYGAMTNLMDNEIQNIPYRIVKRKMLWMQYTIGIESNKKKKKNQNGIIFPSTLKLSNFISTYQHFRIVLKFI